MDYIEEQFKSHKEVATKRNHVIRFYTIFKSISLLQNQRRLCIVSISSISICVTNYFDHKINALKPFNV